MNTMYGFNIEVKLVGTRPDNLDEMLDQLALMCAREAEFEDFMVTRHTSVDATFLIVVNRDAEAMALTSAIMWLHTAVSEAGFATPGWLRSAEQVFVTRNCGRSWRLSLTGHGIPIRVSQKPVRQTAYRRMGLSAYED